ncbi:Carnitine O-acetyltransferase mitochondrial [Nowakowskiella sp. JEL0407]|nr:Carnitine O-acetyltransferase mitochondrial [Nowakowskiella sp. JEL0407]
MLTLLTGKLGKCKASLPTLCRNVSFIPATKPPNRFPLPSLDQTFEVFKKSSRALLPEKPMMRMDEIYSEFIKEDGLGERLQGRLEDRYQRNNVTWYETLFLNGKYLSRNQILPTKSNWYFQFKDHPNQPHDLLIKPPPKGVLSDFQIERAAGLITNMLNYKELLDSGSLHADAEGEQQFCMKQYNQIFGACRIPGPLETDYLNATKQSNAKHIVVLLQDQIYKVNVYGEDNSRLSISDLQRVLFAVGRHCLESAPQPAIGKLTAGLRKNWREAYEILTQTEQNAANLKTISESLFVLCLDDHSTKSNPNHSHQQFFHNTNASNRWFDKSVQIIVASSGRAGSNGHNALVEIPIASKMFQEPAKDPTKSFIGSKPSSPERLEWVTNDDRISKLIGVAEMHSWEVIKKTESVVLREDIYGERYIKEIAKCNIDAYVQLALHLAFYRMYKKHTPIQQLTTHRKFMGGRTEIARSMTEETRDFVDSFDDDDILYADKRKLFRAAVESLEKNMELARAGLGIDNHLFALKAVASENEQKADFFTSSVMRKSQIWRINTLNTSPGTYFFCGFGPQDSEGYGVSYAVGEDDIKVTIATRKTDSTNVYDFRDNFTRILKQMMILFPKRSEVWGKGWEERRRLEKKEEAFMQKLTEISDAYLEKKEALAKKYLRRKLTN